MEYVDGETLEQLIAGRGPIPFERAITLFEQALHAIGFAHRQGILHGNIKPGNLMLNSRDIVKVTDFGFARALQSARHPVLISLGYLFSGRDLI